MSEQCGTARTCEGVDELVDRYRSFLAVERGLAESTVDSYVKLADRFLATLAGSGAIAFDELTPGDARRFLSREAQRLNAPEAVRYAGSSLRALLRFLFVEGWTALPLAEAVPVGPSRRGDAPPRLVDTDTVERLLSRCDRRRSSDRRNYAILLLLVRLGLRAGEVAAIELEDINWRRGELTVRRKGPRREVLPLPVDVGEAIAGYLRRGRPRVDSRHLFLQAVEPYAALSGRSVSNILRRVCDRAGVESFGAHRLRHTAASQMLRQGASLVEIGQVLGHRKAETTAVYAKSRVLHQMVAKPQVGC
jgi:integrase/recombinase XerD